MDKFSIRPLENIERAYRTIALCDFPLRIEGFRPPPREEITVRSRKRWVSSRRVRVLTPINVALFLRYGLRNRSRFSLFDGRTHGAYGFENGSCVKIIFEYFQIRFPLNSLNSVIESFFPGKSRCDDLCHWLRFSGSTIYPNRHVAVGMNRIDGILFE